jgi:lsr operon transcriptional repressor
MRTAEAASALLNEPDISDSLKLAANADIMLVGIGLLRADSYLIRQRVLPLTALATVRAAGAVGDISARFFDANGCAVPSEVDDRVIGLTFAQHCAIPCRIGVAGGTRKREAILAAVRGGLVNVIVTDVETGRWLADQPDPASAGSASAARPVAFDLRSRDPVGEESAGTDSSRT